MRITSTALLTLCLVGCAPKTDGGSPASAVKKPAAGAKPAASGAKKPVAVAQKTPPKKGGGDEAAAQALFDQYSMDFLTGDAEILGNSDVEPGHMVEFRGYGDIFDGKYLVTEVNHLFVAGVINYTTRVVVARNGANKLVE